MSYDDQGSVCHQIPLPHDTKSDREQYPVHIAIASDGNALTRTNLPQYT